MRRIVGIGKVGNGVVIIMLWSKLGLVLAMPLELPCGINNWSGRGSEWIGLDGLRLW